MSYSTKSTIKTKTLVLTPQGAAGSAAANDRLVFGKPVVIEYLQVTYNSMPATTDLTLGQDTSAGATMFTATNCNTNIGPAAMGFAGMDEGGAALGATDGHSGGFPVLNALYAAVAQGDSGAGKNVVITVWYRELRRFNFVLTGVGADGSAAAAVQHSRARPGVVRFIGITFGSGQANTTDIVLKADDSAGRTIWSKSDLSADVALASVGTAGVNGSNAATAVTDGVSGGFPFKRGLYCSLAQGNSGKTTTVTVWYEA